MLRIRKPRRKRFQVKQGTLPKKRAWPKKSGKKKKKIRGENHPTKEGGCVRKKVSVLRRACPKGLSYKRKKISKAKKTEKTR